MLKWKNYSVDIINNISHYTRTEFYGIWQFPFKVIMDNVEACNLVKK